MDRTDKLFMAFLTVLVLGIVVCLAHTVWFHATHHCVRSHQEFVPAHTDTDYYPDSDGNPVIPVTTHYDDEWRTVCDVWEENQ
jgi:hypothetical protein